jgi:hypothetical protein
MGRGLGTEIDDGQGETEREERPREETREVYNNLRWDEFPPLISESNGEKRVTWPVWPAALNLVIVGSNMLGARKLRASTPQEWLTSGPIPVWRS